MSPWQVEDHDGTAVEHATLAAATAALQRVLALAREDAQVDGWSDFMESTALWLRVDHLVELPAEPEDDLDVVEYGIEQAPGLPDALAELLNARPSLRAAVAARLGEVQTSMAREAAVQRAVDAATAARSDGRRSDRAELDRLLALAVQHAARLDELHATIARIRVALDLPVGTPDDEVALAAEELATTIKELATQLRARLGSDGQP